MLSNISSVKLYILRTLNRRRNYSSFSFENLFTKTSTLKHLMKSLGLNNLFVCVGSSEKFVLYTGVYPGWLQRKRSPPPLDLKKKSTEKNTVSS